MKKQQTQNPYCHQTQDVISWLQTFNKASKTSPRQPLQQQLQSLSLSYKNAQQKLLSLQKQTYYESLHNQKQRSIIQILKYIINGSLDDQTILTYLVQMQDQSIPDVQSKYEIRTELEEIKNIVLKRKKEEKKGDSMKTVAIQDLKKEITKCNQMKKELIEDLDRTLNQKGLLETQIQEMKNLNKCQSEQILNFQMQINELKQKQIRTLQQNKQLKEQLQNKSDLIQERDQLLLKVKEQVSKHIHFKNDFEKIQSPKDILKCLRKMQQKHEKYKNMIRDMTQKIKKHSDQNQLIQALKYFLSDQALKIYQQFERTGQKCLIKQLQNISRLERKKYCQLEACQEQVWRLKQRLLRQGSWLKSRKTGVTSGNKQNYQPNLMLKQEKISEFNVELSDNKCI